MMSPLSLEDWVKQQCLKIGFGESGKAAFIGKRALKTELVKCFPERKAEIKKLVKLLKVEDMQRGGVPGSPSSTNSSDSPKISQAPAEQIKLDLKLTESSKSTTTMIKKSVTPKIKSEVGNTGEKALHSSVLTGTRKLKGKNTMTLTSKSEIPDRMPQSGTKDTLSLLDLQLELLNSNLANDETGGDVINSDPRNTVVFTGEVLNTSGKEFPQYGLLGKNHAAYLSSLPDSRVFLNTNIPFSAFVCGIQGSGKSHTTACMVENCLISSPVLGVLQKPLSALVFNFAEFVSASSFRPCELAFLGMPAAQLPISLGVKGIKVLVSPSNLMPLRESYERIPGVLSVQPFMLHPKDLNIGIILTLMSVSQTQTTPLYMGIVTKVLRTMVTETKGAFDYVEFRRRLKSAGLDRMQKHSLNQRLDLLESFLDLNESTASLTFDPGEMTVIDLSCPFVDSSTACVFFRIGMEMYLGSSSNTGKVIVLDEAHKYMTDTLGSKALTDSLMGVIRQQRHYGARVIISTQEPNISPKLIDLCSITVIHRFSSPEWLEVLRRHILVSDTAGGGGDRVKLLREIMRLRTGEALVFAPSARIGDGKAPAGCDNGADDLLRMTVRKRVTWDSGRSIVCV